MFFYVFFVSHLTRKFGGAGVRGLGLFFIGIALIGLAALRDRSVGTDTYEYVSWLQYITNLDEAFSFHTELGFNLLVLFSSFLSDGYVLFLGLIAFIVVFFYLWGIWRQERLYEYSVLAFFALGAYGFLFNGARQAIAGSICFFSIHYLLERKAVRYFLLIIVASFFHVTALVAIPLYFAFVSRGNWRQFAVVALGVLVGVVYIGNISQLASGVAGDRYAHYGQSGVGGGYLFFVFLFAQAVFFFLMRKKTSDTERYSYLLGIYLLGLIPAFVTVILKLDPSGMLRLSNYFSHASILIWPMVLSSHVFAGLKGFQCFFYVVFMFVFFFYVTYNLGGMYPYSFNLSIF